MPLAGGGVLWCFALDLLFHASFNLDHYLVGRSNLYHVFEIFGGCGIFLLLLPCQFVG
jgi:hypothetical protein